MENIIELSIMIGGGVLAGTLGGLLGIGGGIVLMPILRFFVGLSPAVSAGTCIVAVFFTTLGGSFRHYKLGHVNIRSILPVIIAGGISTILFSLGFFILHPKRKVVRPGNRLGVFSHFSPNGHRRIRQLTQEEG